MASDRKSPLAMVFPLLAVGVLGALAIGVLGGDSETFGPILVIIFTVGFIFLSFRVARQMNRGFSGQDVVERGVPAKAVIVSMAETGMTVNQHPMVEFGLRVTMSDGSSFDDTVQQMLPRLLLGQVTPGTSVNVAVAGEGESREVAIDFGGTAGASEPAGPQRLVSEGHMAGARISGEVISRDAFLARAISATGEIDAMSETGEMATNPDTGQVFEAYGYTVTVMRAGQPPYQTKLLQGLPDDLRGRVGPGARVPIGINPDDPNDIIIDWDSHRA